MRQIKFRGHAISDSCGQSVDKIVHGDLIHEWNKPCILDDDDGDIYEVEPESVAQLIAVDINGREVYEGDMVERIADYDPDFDRAKAFPMAATFDDFSAINDGQIILVEAHHDD